MNDFIGSIRALLAIIQYNFPYDASLQVVQLWNTLA